jgi:delta24-sterol reductase
VGCQIFLRILHYPFQPYLTLDSGLLHAHTSAVPRSPSEWILLTIHYSRRLDSFPYSKSDEFLQYLENSFYKYPIWLCPLKQSGKSIAPIYSLPSRENEHKDDGNDAEFWRLGTRSQTTRRVLWRRYSGFESKVHDLGGQKWLYAHACYTEERSIEIYNREEYGALRVRYHATYLPTVYDKVKVDLSKEL